MTAKLSRRSLFDAFRAPVNALAAPAPAPAVAAAPPVRVKRAPSAPSPEHRSGFSLDGFYARRAPSALPVEPLRVGLPEIATTAVGAGPTGASTPRAGVHGAVRPVTARLAGKVRVRLYACLAHAGSFCSTCAERCPVPGAIVLDAGRPRVQEELCDGCGVCVGVCPAPVNGFDIVSAGLRHES